jgi:hypothetical protein
MKAPCPTLRLLGLALLPLGLAAQSAPAPSAAAATARPPSSEVVPARPVDGSVAAAGSNTLTRVSPEVRASLRDAIPQFEAPRPATPPPAAEPDPGPNNEIVRLPTVEVQADRPPVFKNEELYSTRDQRILALRKYAGLNVTPFGWINRLNAPIAMQMYEEDQRLMKMQQVSDTAAAFSRAGDKETSEYLKKTSNATFLRSPDFGRLKKQ